MKKYIAKVILLSLVSISVFASSPPDEFLNTEACASITEWSCSLKELLDVNFPKATLKWEQDGANWILRVAVTDKLTKQVKEFSLELIKKQDSFNRSVVLSNRVSVMMQNKITGEVFPATDPGETVWYGFANNVGAKLKRKDELKAASDKAKKDKAVQSGKANLEKMLSSIEGEYIYPEDLSVAYFKITRKSGNTFKFDLKLDPGDKLSYIFKAATKSGIELKLVPTGLGLMPGLVGEAEGMKFTFMDYYDEGLSKKIPSVNVDGDGISSPSGLSIFKATDEIKKRAKEIADTQTEKVKQIDAQISQYSGKYKNTDTEQRGEFSINAISKEKFVISFVKRSCAFTEKAFVGTYDDESKKFMGEFSDNTCKLSATIGAFKDDQQRDVFYIRVQESGDSCAKLCGTRNEDSAGLMGNYQKIMQ